MSSFVCLPQQPAQAPAGRKKGERGGPCSGTAESQFPREQHSKVVQLLRKRSPSQRPFPGNTGLQCEKVPRLFLTAGLWGIAQRQHWKASPLCRVEGRHKTIRTGRTPAVLCHSIVLKCKSVGPSVWTRTGLKNQVAL